jgi:excisionase family DNA binding protein
VTEFLSPRRAAEVCDCTEHGIRKWIRQGRLPAVKIGRLVRIRKADLDAAIRFGLTAAKRS